MSKENVLKKQIQEMLGENTIGGLIAQALKMRGRSYAPYSHFCVGAALLAEDGEVFTGCNIENAAFTPTICAERTAVFKAVSEGKRSFRAIAIAGGKEGEPPEFRCPPCGVCRQVMAEFCNPDFPVIMAKNECEYDITAFSDLLPRSFGPEDL